jgi:transposase
MKNINILGIDLAKNVFQLHGTDHKGKCVLSKRLSREKLIEFVSNLHPCIIGIEACGSAHFWARLFIKSGHEVRMMAPQFVKPYVKSNKNDRNDAEGIAEACTRPGMKFVPIKKMSQQDTLLLHRARELVIKQRTAQANQIRGLLMEYGIALPKNISNLKRLPEILEREANKLTPRSIEIFNRLYDQFKKHELELQTYEKEIEKELKQNRMSKEIMKIEGIGPIIASALMSTIGDPKVFKNGREVSAWLGLVPKQHSSGNKIRLSGISKRGDCYVRKLLIQGARAVVKTCEGKNDRRHTWLLEKKKQGGYNKAAVALANKNARIVWAMLSTGECYRVSKACDAH